MPCLVIALLIPVLDPLEDLLAKLVLLMIWVAGYLAWAGAAAYTAIMRLLTARPPRRGKRIPTGAEFLNPDAPGAAMSLNCHGTPGRPLRYDGMVAQFALIGLIVGFALVGGLALFGHPDILEFGLAKNGLLVVLCAAIGACLGWALKLCGSSSNDSD